MKKVFLVTGGAGFIGSNLARSLVESGKSVRVLDNLATGRRENLADMLDRIELVEGDITNPSDVKSAVRDVEAVFHLAALPSVVRSVEDPVTSTRVNIDGTVNILTAARDAGVERFVFSSSSSVYGDSPVIPKKESDVPMPLSPYAVQKLTGEHFCRVFHSLYGLPTFALRYFNVFGPRQNPASQYAAVIPLFVRAFCCGKNPTIDGDGEQTRDFTFVDDVVGANVCCLDAPESAAGGVYNVARGDRISINDLAERLLSVTGSKSRPVHGPPRPGDVRDSMADARMAREHIGWEPEVTFEEGLRRTVDWFSQ